MAGFEVIIYGRFWVIAEDRIASSAQGIWRLLPFGSNR